MSIAAALRPHAGFEVTATRPDGVSYPAHLCRMDGPHGGIAVLYVEPADCPTDMQPYTQEVYVEELSAGAQVCTLAYTDEQAARVRAWAQKVLSGG